MSSDITLAGIRDAVMGVNALVPAARLEGEMAARQAVARSHQVQVESRAEQSAEKLAAGPDLSKASLPLLVAERSRTPGANALQHEPDLRGRRRKMRRFPRSRFTELAQQLGRHLDVSV